MIPQGASATREAILRAVAFFDTMDYAPTMAEAIAWAEGAGTCEISDSVFEEGEGRIALRSRLQHLLTLSRERTPLFPRKLRRAQQVTKWLVRNPNVRLVALANTTALAHARHEGDLDFFVIVRHGSIWSTRLIAGTPYRLTHQLAGGPDEQPDAVCLSYFISDAGLNLQSHLLPDGDDPYFRYWFLALLPLYDDGVSQQLWDANAHITNRHPHAELWIPSPDIQVRRPTFRIPATRLLEAPAKAFQQKWFPPSIRNRMNTDTAVLVSDATLKFHTDDGRRRFRTAYEERLRSLLL